MTPIRCRIFGHDYRDPHNGYFYFPCEEGRAVLVGVCKRCGEEWWYGVPLHLALGLKVDASSEASK